MYLNLNKLKNVFKVAAQDARNGWLTTLHKSTDLNSKDRQNPGSHMQGLLSHPLIFRQNAYFLL
jgi:hypothetical protein